MFYYPFPKKKIVSKIAYNCNKCKLNQKPMKSFIGDNYDGLVVVAEAPTKEDVFKQMPLINEKAQIIRSESLKNKINLITKGAIVYALQCHPGKNASDTQFRCCRNKLAEELNILQPKIIICLGEMAFKSIMDLSNKISINKLRNRLIPNYEFNCFVFPVFNPNDIMSYNYKYALVEDLKRVYSLFNNKFNKRKNVDLELKKRKILEGITINEIKTFAEIKEATGLINQLGKISLDYETTNVKPFDNNFEIISIAFSTKSTAWVFHEDLWKNNPDIWNYITKFMQDILINPKILKIIQNAKFEDLCSRYVFGIKKIDYKQSFCPMLATHVVDERQGCTSLDFQNLVRFGIPPYSDTVKSFLETKEKNDLINNIRNAPHNDLILYAGLDVITTYNNYLILDEILLPNAYPKARDNYLFLHKGHWAFANMTQRGIPIDPEKFDWFDEILENKMNIILKQISEIPEIQEYNQFLSQKDKVKKGEEQLIELTMKVRNKDNGSSIKQCLRKISFN